jgi:hypothetical protein
MKEILVSELVNEDQLSTSSLLDQLRDFPCHCVHHEVNDRLVKQCINE